MNLVQEVILTAVDEMSVNEIRALQNEINSFMSNLCNDRFMEEFH